MNGPTPESRPIRVLGIVGSLRRESYNRRLVEAARQLTESMTIEPASLAGIPIYNPDTDVDGTRPGDVERLKVAIADADALLISTPEYNYSIPGVLKNAIDWASRPSAASPLRGKPIGIMGASPSSLGGVRAQEHLKLVMMSTMALVMPHPTVAVGHAGDKFDQTGTLVHEPTRKFLAAFLRELHAWTIRLSPASP
jgi:chromate reductase